MKKVTRLLSLGLLILTLFSNCSKERIQPDPTPDPIALKTYASLDQFYNTYKQPEQEFVITQDGTGPIIGNQGTKIWGSKSIFMHQNGTDVEYPFTIKLIELYTPKDMILYKMPTVASGNLLVTDGEIRVKAFKGTEELLLKPSAGYSVEMPADTFNSNMQIFYGKSNGSIVDWTDDPSTISSISKNDTIASISSGATLNSYLLRLPLLGWINADYFNNTTTTKSAITFSSTTDDLTNVAKFLYFIDLPSIMQVYGNTSGEIPVGSNVKVICFAKDADGKMFFFTQDLSVATNQNLDVTLTEITEANLITFLESL